MRGCAVLLIFLTVIVSKAEVNLYLPTLHPKQKEIITNAKRYNHLRCGRRFGKTTLIEELSSVAIDGYPVGIWFPTYKDLSEVWKDLKKLYNPIIYRQNEQLKQINLYGGGLIDFWSMEDPDSGQGRKYKRAIIDEAAKAPKLYQAYENTIRPTLTDYIGDLWMMSRPKGINNGFYRIEEKHKQFDNWAFFHFTSYDNCKDVGGHLERSEIDEAKSQLDEITFAQEYMAEYVDVNDKPYLYAFVPAKHVIKSYTPNPHLNLLVSFDFNKEPMTAIVSQKPTVKSLRIFDEIRINSGSTPEVCDVLIAKYKSWLGRMTVTGDATGRNRTSLVQGNRNHYDVITQKLGLGKHDLVVPRQNNSHLNSRLICNSVLQNADVQITASCQETIRDCHFAAVDDKGELIKTVADGRHFFDNTRYTIEAAYPNFIDDFHLYK